MEQVTESRSLGDIASKEYIAVSYLDLGWCEVPYLLLCGNQQHCPSPCEVRVRARQSPGCHVFLPKSCRVIEEINRVEYNPTDAEELVGSAMSHCTEMTALIVLGK